MPCFPFNSIPPVALIVPDIAYPAFCRQTTVHTEVCLSQRSQQPRTINSMLNANKLKPVNEQRIIILRAAIAS